MKTFNSLEFEQEAQRLKYDLAIKEIFGQDVIPIYVTGRVFLLPRMQALIREFSMVSIWYLQQLLTDSSPAKIVDIGCGDNLFKPVIKKIYGIPCHGIDPTPGNKAADEFDYFDSDFSQGHTGAYDSVFSINALHFVPLWYLTTRIKEFHNVVAPGGRGFLALNCARMFEATSPEWLEDTFGSALPSPAQVQDYVSNQLSTLDIDFVVLDLLIAKYFDEWMDGNIRMVFKK